MTVVREGKALEFVEGDGFPVQFSHEDSLAAADLPPTPRNLAKVRISSVWRRREYVLTERPPGHAMGMTTNAPRVTLSARLPLNRTHGCLKFPDALNETGQFVRDARDFGLQVGQALGRLAGCLLTGGRVTHVGATPSDTLHQSLFSELRVGTLHGHQRDTELFGVSPATWEAVPRTERSRSDLVSDPCSDFAGVGLPLRL